MSETEYITQPTWIGNGDTKTRDDDIHNALYEIRDHAYLTGSRAFGLESEFSDYDYLIDGETFIDIWANRELPIFDVNDLQAYCKQMSQGTSSKDTDYSDEGPLDPLCVRVLQMKTPILRAYADTGEYDPQCVKVHNNYLLCPNSECFDTWKETTVRFKDKMRCATFAKKASSKSFRVDQFELIRAEIRREQS